MFTDTCFNTSEQLEKTEKKKKITEKEREKTKKIG